jgi:hypothetical protein
VTVLVDVLVLTLEMVLGAIALRFLQFDAGA